jgi:hypothetical protein
MMKMMIESSRRREKILRMKPFGYVGLEGSETTCVFGRILVVHACLWL